MKVSIIDNYLHIMDNLTNSWNIVRNIADSEDKRDPFYICNVGDIVNKYETWKSLMPRVRPVYDVKCNNSPMVIEILASLGSGFSCTTKNEMNQVLEIGVSSDHVLFDNPIKPAGLLKHALNSGVSVMTVDSESELYKIKRLHPKAELIIRCKIGENLSEFEFGCDPISEAPALLNIAHSLDLNVVGVSFQVDPDNRNPHIYGYAIETARELFDCASKLGFDLKILNLGGGFPGDSYGEYMDRVAENINRSLEIFFPDMSVNIVAEPSRYLVDSAYTLVCNIHSIRSIEKVDATTGDYHNHRMYFINDGVYGSFSSVLYNQQYSKPRPLNKHTMSKMYSSSIWGPTADGLDEVVEEIVLPEMNAGEWIIFENMGAYTFPTSCPLNGFPTPKVHVMAYENIWYSLSEMMTFTEDHFTMGKQNGENSSVKTIPNLSYDSVDILSLQNDIFNFKFQK